MSWGCLGLPSSVCDPIKVCGIFLWENDLVSNNLDEHFITKFPNLSWSPTFITIFISLWYFANQVKGKKKKRATEDGRKGKKEEGRKGRKGRNLPIETLFHIFPANCKIQIRFQYHSCKDYILLSFIGPTCYLLIPYFYPINRYEYQLCLIYSASPGDIIVNLRDIVLPFLELMF